MKLFNKILAIILIPTVIGVIVYLIAAFVAYDFNPKTWSGFGRALVGILEFIALAIGIHLAYE